MLFHAGEEGQADQVGGEEGQADLVALLHARGQRATPQRLVILRELRQLARHVTAEELHRRVHEELPGTSTPTVYATLELLVELGLAEKLDVGAGVSLYDARTDPHEHAVCRRCGQVQDIDGAPDATSLLRRASKAGFRPHSAQFLIFGCCAACAEVAELSAT